MSQYRSRSRVVLDLLRTIEREAPVAITRLITVANMTHGRVQEHLGAFEENGLVENQGPGDRPQWTLTEKGQRALAELRRIDDAMRDFGIEL